MDTVADIKWYEAPKECPEPGFYLVVYIEKGWGDGERRIAQLDVPEQPAAVKFDNFRRKYDNLLHYYTFTHISGKVELPNVG
jgi:hypothetical protein